MIHIKWAWYAVGLAMFLFTLAQALVPTSSLIMMAFTFSVSALSVIIASTMKE